MVRARRSHEGGFTLLELGIVMMLLAVLFGIGLGFLQRDTKSRDIALAQLRDALRVARNSAVTRNAPADVLIDSGQEGELSSVRARVLEVVGVWPLEEGQAPLSRGLGALLTGEPVATGRFGACRRPTADESLLVVPADRTASSVFDLSEGYVFRCDLRLDEREAATIVTYGRALSLRLEPDLHLVATMTLALPGPRPGPVVRVRSPLPLSLHRWTHVAVLHDGERLAILVDDDEVAADRARGQAFVGTQPAPFEVSPRDGQVRGLVDSIELHAYRVEDPRLLPDTIFFEGVSGPIRFLPDGSLAREVEFTLVEGEERVAQRIVAGGILQ